LPQPLREDLQVFTAVGPVLGSDCSNFYLFKVVGSAAWMTLTRIWKESSGALSGR
jgi:hypothetical protein